MTNATKISLLKKIDQLIGSLLVLLFPRPTAPDFSSEQGPGRVLFIRPGGIGDAVLLVPVLQALKQQHPEARIDVLAEKRNAAIFTMCTVVDRVLLYDQGGLFPVLRNQYDVVIDTEQWHRLTAVVARLVRAPVKIGYGTNERRKLYTHAIDYCHDRYELDSFSDLLQPLSMTRIESSAQPFLQVPELERRSVCELLTPTEGHSFVTLFPGASIAERRWGAGKFHQLALRLNDAGYPVVVIGGREDQVAGEAIIAGADGLNLAGKTSLVGSAAVVERSVLLISGDSGMLHIGVGLNKPTVSLFGSGIAAKWAPRGDRHVVINKQLPCSPCTRFGTTPPCPIGSKCLSEISVDEVVEGAASLLADCQVSL